ncbi:hypothetical protein BCR33DRAFT_852652 [Rhizoclosmatium globosum]|uniref:Uncharacterized protein n=1 Tax=Rhizoclosmatium globosum TaxID=329046 RepID=A0A1Y2C1K8_9FUNG|nr:hypothetical protein BCR33DRAFT_852652 [Rhizoclosmatium globosum]|eukprot:ORY40784.1 hypothetical protein BCR33DRAFT_852652 [Rhizoclosmatium globosum]
MKGPDLHTLVEEINSTNMFIPPIDLADVFWTISLPFLPTESLFDNDETNHVFRRYLEISHNNQRNRELESFILYGTENGIIANSNELDDTSTQEDADALSDVSTEPPELVEDGEDPFADIPDLISEEEWELQYFFETMFVCLKNIGNNII